MQFGLIFQDTPKHPEYASATTWQRLGYHFCKAIVTFLAEEGSREMDSPINVGYETLKFFCINLLGGKGLSSNPSMGDLITAVGHAVYHAGHIQVVRPETPEVLDGLTDEFYADFEFEVCPTTITVHAGL